MSDIRVPVIRTIRVPNMRAQVSVALGFVDRLSNGIRTLHDDAKACPKTIVRGNVTLEQDLYGALFDIREAVDCLQDVLDSLDFVQDKDSGVPVVPPGSDIFSHQAKGLVE